MFDAKTFTKKLSDCPVTHSDSSKFVDVLSPVIQINLIVTESDVVRQSQMIIFSGFPMRDFLLTHFPRQPLPVELLI